MDGASEGARMTVKAILVRLRKERRAIDKAISALEKVGKPSARKRHGPKPARKLTLLEAATQPEVVRPDPPARSTKIIDFPGSDRTA